MSSDLPVVRMDKIPLERQIRDFIRIIAQIFYSEDYLVKQILLDRGILDLLSQVAVCRPELTVDVFDIVSQLSSNPEYEKFTSNRNIILQELILRIFTVFVKVLFLPNTQKGFQIDDSLMALSVNQLATGRTLANHRAARKYHSRINQRQ